MKNPERWRTDTRYRVVSAITIGLLPTIQILLSVTSHTSALLLVSQLDQDHSLPWFLCCLMMFLIPSLCILLTDGVPVIIQPVSIPPWRQLCVHLILHSLHTTGLVLITFFSLPSLSILQSCCLLGSFSLVPSMINLLKMSKKNVAKKTKIADILCFVTQLSCVISWPIVLTGDLVWTLPIGLVLTSVGYSAHSLSSLDYTWLHPVEDLTTWTPQQRKVYHTLSALITLILAMLSFLSPHVSLNSSESQHFGLPLLLLCIQLASSLLLRLLSFFSCRTKLTTVGLVAPLTLAPVITLLPIGFLTHFCSRLPLFHGSQLVCSSYPDTEHFILLPLIFLLTYTSQCWVLRRSHSHHSYLPPTSSTMLLQQTLLCNLYPKKSLTSPDVRPTVLACATMWHETAEEMRALLVSVFKVDRDQAKQENKNNFKWEIHVLFDDAINCNHRTGEIVPNEFLRIFCQEMKSLMISYSQTEMSEKEAENVKITKTPYGGLLVWKLPGGSVLYCHLKEKIVIRNKKRWSQCMYFLYFLGHPLLPKSPFKSDSTLDNTFILALDGDVEFSYPGVKRLIEVFSPPPQMSK